MPSPYAEPERMSIANLQTGESLDVLFNPTELAKSFNVKWNRLEVPGLPHEVLQYKGTSNLRVPLQLIAHAFTQRPSAAATIDEFEKFIMSLGYPSENAQSVASGAPPRCLVIWPGVLVFTAQLVDEVKFTHTQFASRGGSLRYAANVTFEEVRDSRLTSEDVRFFGTLRLSTSTSE